MNDDFLNAQRKEPRPQFAAALYRRISSPMKSQLPHNSLRFAATTGALLAVLAAALLFSPSARAFAEGIIRQVGGFAFVLDGQPVNLRGSPGPIRIVKTLGAVSIETIGEVPSANDLAGASRLAGFPVLAPAYLPAGYTAMSGWYITSDSGGNVATNGYRDATDHHFLVLNQWQVGGGARREFARPQIVDVTVRGHPGLWLPDTINGPAGKNALVWDEGGITYSIITDAVPLDEMLKVADSLAH
jgi:hypothetical protein